MSGHEVIRDLVAAVALGAATEQETAEVERHAATCAECRAELDGLRAAAAGLALGVPQIDPPAALKRRVMEAVRTEGVRPVAPAPARRRFGRWPALAGTLAAIAVGLLAWNLTLHDGKAADRSLAFHGTTVAPQVRGTLTVHRDGTATMRITGLPTLPNGQGYELWTIRNGKPRSEGFPARTAGGEVIAATGDLTDASALAITGEPRGNVAAPSEQPSVVVQLPV